MSGSADPGEGLCLSCGLCCDGSLFWAVPVGPEEDPPVPLDAERRLCQPCTRFDGRCTIYAQRPKGCRAFDCGVLQRLRAGRVGRADADRQIGAMRRIVADLDARLPGHGSVYARAAAFLEDHAGALRTPAFQRRHRALLGRLSDYEAALRRFHVTGAGGA